MTRHIGVKPRWPGALALWAGSDHYSLYHALRGAEFRLPTQKVSRVYRFALSPVLGQKSIERFAVAYHSSRRECLVVLDSLPEPLESVEQVRTSPLGLVRLYLKMIWREPTAVLSLLLVPLPIFFMMVLFLVWVNFFLQSPDILALFANPGCDAGCVQKVIKIHSMVGVLFLTPLALLFVPLSIMIFQAPRYRSALNFRISQSYSAITLAFAIYALVHLMVLFPFRGYGKFVMAGFGPQAERFLDSHGLKK